MQQASNSEESSPDSLPLCALFVVVSAVILHLTRYLVALAVDWMLDILYTLVINPIITTLCLLSVGAGATYVLGYEKALLLAVSQFFNSAQRICHTAVQGHFLLSSPPSTPNKKSYSLQRNPSLTLQDFIKDVDSISIASSSSSSDADSLTSGGSSFKHIASHRLPDDSLDTPDNAMKKRSSSRNSLHVGSTRRSSSVGADGSAVRVERRPKPRTSLDFEAAHVTTPRARRDYQYRGHRSHRSGSGSRYQQRERLQRHRHQQLTSFMPRIESGQELAVTDMGSFYDSQQQHAQYTNDSAELCITEHNASSLVEDGSECGPCTPPNEPVSPSCSIASNTSSTSSWATWAAECSQDLLRPLVPSQAAIDSLMKWQPPLSPPWGWRLKHAPANTSTATEIVSPRSIMNRSGSQTSMNGGGRSSLEGGPTHRHYTHGAVCCEAEHKEVLQQYAQAARMQALSVVSENSHVAAGGAAGSRPGHVRVASLDGSAAACSSAVASIGLDGDCPQSVREVITDEHLLQFAALIDDLPAQQLTQQLGIPLAYGYENSLYGLGSEEQQQQLLVAGPAAAVDWECVLEQHRPGLTVQAWRMLHRNGLYLYRSSVILENVTPREVRPFHIDDQARLLWDDGAMFVRRVLPPGCTRLSKHSESCMHKYTSRFPRPMAPREYNYARRVWHRPIDGGCYTISRSLPLPADSEAPKAVQVTDYTSCALVRAVPGGTEIVGVYFEDSLIRAGLAKMGVPKALWPFWTKYEDALRVFVEAREAAATLAPHHHHHHHGHHRRSASYESAAAMLGKCSSTNALSQVHDLTTDNISTANGQCSGNSDADSISDSGSEDGVYDVLDHFQLMKRHRVGKSNNHSSAVWARRLIIAGAFKMLQMTLAPQTNNAKRR